MPAASSNRAEPAKIRVVDKVEKIRAPVTILPFVYLFRSKNGPLSFCDK